MDDTSLTSSMNKLYVGLTQPPGRPSQGKEKLEKVQDRQVSIAILPEELLQKILLCLEPAVCVRVSRQFRMLSQQASPLITDLGLREILSTVPRRIPIKIDRPVDSLPPVVDELANPKHREDRIVLMQSNKAVLHINGCIVTVDLTTNAIGIPKPATSAWVYHGQVEYENRRGIHIEGNVAKPSIRRPEGSLVTIKAFDHQGKKYYLHESNLLAADGSVVRFSEQNESTALTSTAPTARDAAGPILDGRVVDDHLYMIKLMDMQNRLTSIFKVNLTDMKMVALKKEHGFRHEFSAKYLTAYDGAVADTKRLHIRDINAVDFKAFNLVGSIRRITDFYCITLEKPTHKSSTFRFWSIQPESLPIRLHALRTKGGDSIQIVYRDFYVHYSYSHKKLWINKPKDSFDESEPGNRHCVLKEEILEEGIIPLSIAATHKKIMILFLKSGEGNAKNYEIRIYSLSGLKEQSMNLEARVNCMKKILEKISPLMIEFSPQINPAIQERLFLHLDRDRILDLRTEDKEGKKMTSYALVQQQLVTIQSESNNTSCKAEEISGFWKEGNGIEVRKKPQEWISRDNIIPAEVIVKELSHPKKGNFYVCLDGAIRDKKSNLLGKIPLEDYNIVVDVRIEGDELFVIHGNKFSRKDDELVVFNIVKKTVIHPGIIHYANMSSKSSFKNITFSDEYLVVEIGNDDPYSTESERTINVYTFKRFLESLKYPPPITTMKLNNKTSLYLVENGYLVTKSIVSGKSPYQFDFYQLSNLDERLTGYTLPSLDFELRICEHMYARRFGNELKISLIKPIKDTTKKQTIEELRNSGLIARRPLYAGWQLIDMAVFEKHIAFMFFDKTKQKYYLLNAPLSNEWKKLVSEKKETNERKEEEKE